MSETVALPDIEKRARDLFVNKKQQDMTFLESMAYRSYIVCRFFRKYKMSTWMPHHIGIPLMEILIEAEKAKKLFYGETGESFDDLPDEGKRVLFNLYERYNRKFTEKILEIIS